MLTLLVFSRVPQPGRCKTRLIPKLGARGAAWVQMRLVEHVLTACHRAGVQLGVPVRLVLSNTPKVRHPFFSRCQQRHPLLLRRQPNGDLGQKMVKALRPWLVEGPVLLMGSDAFGLTAEDIVSAAKALAQNDYVLTPASDGGYVLIGARKPLPSLAGVRWSSGVELVQTLMRLRASGSVALTPHTRSDFDWPRDWQRARRAGLMAPLIHTQR